MTFFRSASRGVIGLLSVAAIALGSLGLAGSASAQAAEPAPVGTTTTVSLENNPTVYGDIAMFSATVEIDAAAILNGHEVRFEIDGVLGSPNYLVYAGEGKFKTLFPTTIELGVGTHAIIAKFAGVTDAESGIVDVLPSESEPLELTINQAPTTTVMTAPSAVTAFEQIDVTATVQAAAGPLATELSGNAVLLADGSPMMYEALDAVGGVLFDDVVVPWGARELTVAYLGDDAGNFAISTSAISPIELTPLATESTLALSTTEIRADGEVTLMVTVQNTHAASTVDPVGGLEVFVDGAPWFAEYPSTNLDPAADGTARFEAHLVGLTLGQHDIQAAFVPGDGFLRSQSEAAELRVMGIETSLVPSAVEVTGTLEKPASVGLSATVAEAGDLLVTRSLQGAGDPVDGYVQAFVESQPFGEPVNIVDGQGNIEFAGLATGVHEVELRFTPAEQGMLRSSAIVNVTVTADAAGPSQQTATLSNTGVGPSPVLIGGAALLLVVGVVLMAARRRV